MKLLFAAAMLSACAASPGAEPVSEIGPGELYADVLAARYADYANDPRQAALRARAAAERAPADQELVERAFLASLLTAEDAFAIQSARSLVAIEPTHAAARLALASDAIRRARYREAIAHLDAAQPAPLENLLGTGLRAFALAGLGRTHAGLEALDEERGPLGRLLDLQRGLLHLRRNDPQAALVAFEEAERAGLRLPALVTLRGEALLRLGREQAARDLYEDRLEQGESLEIQAALDRLSAAAPPPRRSVREDAALGLFSVTVALLGQSQDRETAPYLAMVMMLDSGMDPALLSFTEDMGEGPADALARELLQRVAKDSPYWPLARAQIAWRLADLDRMEEALAVSAGAAAAGGRFARSVHADLLRQAGRYAEAEALYTTLIGELAEPTERDWRLFFARAVAHERQGDWAGAEADLIVALDLAPNEPEVMNYLGYGWVDRGQRLEEALALLQRAAALRPNAGHILDSYAWANFKLGRLDEAHHALERAIEASPSDPAINDHLGDVYWALGRRIEARFQWTKALALDPEPALRAAIERKLEAPPPPNEVLSEATGG